VACPAKHDESRRDHQTQPGPRKGEEQPGERRELLVPRGGTENAQVNDNCGSDQQEKAEVVTSQTREIRTAELVIVTIHGICFEPFTEQHQWQPFGTA